MPAFMQTPTKAGLVPTNSAFAAAAKRHSAPGSGKPGWPSMSTALHSPTSAEASRFHMIQPLEVYQKKRSPRRRSNSKARLFSVFISMPPWPCTIGLGGPEVPEE